MKLSDELYLFNEGRNFQAYRLLGAHLTKAGTVFRVWAPNAGSVSVVGDFNGWRGDANAMHPLGASGIWEVTVAEAHPGNLYRFEIATRDGGIRLVKSDPYGRGFELRPGSAAYVVPPSGPIAGATPTGWQGAPAGTGSTRRSISTNCIPVHGCAIRTASPTCGANWPSA
jgi:1,4-alpha-glucan branching enzyme